MVALTNKVIVITGAGTGLGRETAIQAAKAGAKVAVCCRQQANMDSLLSTGLAPYKDNVLALQVDVSVEKEVKRFVEAIITTFGRIDVLVNNAAIFENYEVVDMPLSSWERHFENNVTTAFLMAQNVIPIMRSQKDGRIISLTSGLARQGAAGFGAYSASKAALESLSYSIEEEEYQNGISTCTFNTGVMKSALHAIGDDPRDVAPILLYLAGQPTLRGTTVVTYDELKDKVTPQ